MGSMQRGNRAFTHGAGDPATETTIFSRLTADLGRLGFLNCAYLLRMPLPLSNRGSLLFDTTMPDSGTRRAGAHAFAANGGTLSDFLLRVAAASESDPWSRWLITSAASGDHLYGIRELHGSAGMTGRFLISYDREKYPSLSEPALRAEVDDIVCSGHAQISESMFRRFAPERFENLSAREREILCWTSDGKTSEEIAIILGIAKVTVNFHLKQVVRKLRSSNKTHAAVKACLFGLI